MSSYVSDAELEIRALQLLDAYEEVAGPLLAPPVPIDLIIEHVLGFDIVWDLIDIGDLDVRVLAAIDGSSKRIIMNDREITFFETYFGTENYSKAHEVGHAVLHVPMDLTPQTSLFEEEGNFTLCRANLHERREIQAERFAAYLLMPKELIHNRLKKQDITRWSQIYELRDAFGVSVTAMYRRLRELNLAYVDAQRRVFPSREAASGQRRLL
jgi:hypothetical protein